MSTKDFKYTCINCNYNTNKTNDYTKHLSTKKHNIKHNNLTENNCNNKLYVCKCGNKYKHDSSYYRHKKFCDLKVEQNNLTNSEKDKLILSLVKQNNILMNILLSDNIDNI